MKTKALLMFILAFCLMTTKTTGQISSNIIYPAQGSTSVQDYPFDGTNGYTYNASIYNKNNIGVGGKITGLGFYVATPCSDSVTVTILAEQRTSAMFGGSDTWANTTAGGTQVYHGKVKFGSMGMYFFALQNQIVYDKTKHLGIYISCEWGGTGPSTPPAFACASVNSSVEYVNLKWGQDNSFPTSQLGQLTNFLPYIALRYKDPDDAVIAASTDTCGEIEILTIALGATDQVLIASNHTGNFSDPGCGVSYSAGDTLFDGSEVIYSGPDGYFSHINTMPGQQYQYKVWAYDTAHVYSSNGNAADAISNYNIPYINSFDGGAGLPLGFSGGMVVMPSHGETDQGLVAELTPSISVLNLFTPDFCGLTANSKLQFDYRIVNISSYPSVATPAAEIDSIKIKMKDPNTGVYTLIHSITPFNHVAATDFVSVELPIGYFSGGLTCVLISAISGTGSYYVDIDNFAITDPAGIDGETQQHLNIYPNPAENILNISQHESTEIRILDLTGRVVIKKQCQNNETLSIDVSALSPGLYLIESDGSVSAKFFKQ